MNDNEDDLCFHNHGFPFLLLLGNKHCNQMCSLSFSRIKPDTLESTVMYSILRLRIFIYYTIFKELNDDDYNCSLQCHEFSTVQHSLNLFLLQASLQHRTCHLACYKI